MTANSFARCVDLRTRYTDDKLPRQRAYGSVYYKVEAIDGSGGILYTIDGIKITK